MPRCLPPPPLSHCQFVLPSISVGAGDNEKQQHFFTHKRHSH
jgi:hypothetical protein